MTVVVLWFVLVVSFQSDCPDSASCSQASLDAVARGDFEAAHDLAWRAAQKGRPNDPKLMALVARAQSLSGRPTDALVMLRRLAQTGVAVDDAVTSDDYRRVRALAGWPEVEAMMKAAAPLVEAPRAERARSNPPPPVKPAVETVAAPPKTAARETARGSGATPAEESLPGDVGAIQPAGLAYDAVSRRFILGDRHANKLVIFDDVFKQVTDMAGAESTGFFGLTALEIDRRRGDLWVANSSAQRGASLHKLQLVSGRVLFEVPVPTDLGPTTVVDIAVLGDGEVLVLDEQGRRLLALSPGGRAFRTIVATNVMNASSLTSISDGVAYIAHPRGLLRVDLAARTTADVTNAPLDLRRIRAHGGQLVGIRSVDGGQRVIRLRLGRNGRSVTQMQILDDQAAMPDASALTNVDGVVSYITSNKGGLVMRRRRTHALNRGSQVLRFSGSRVLGFSGSANHKSPHLRTKNPRTENREPRTENREPENPRTENPAMYPGARSSDRCASLAGPERSTPESPPRGA